MSDQGAFAFAETGSSAVFSPCGLYRHRLDRKVADTGPVVAVPGVNPSTADAEKNDATIRKDIGFGQRLGWGRIIKPNKFQLCATDVRELRDAADPIGPYADEYLYSIFKEADLVVPAWGPLAKLPRPLRQRWRRVVHIAQDAGHDTLWCFGTAQDGQPRHTLMLAYSTPLTPWRPPTP
ncbi:DUF1643 domain-containing protein [Henriciella mobilis]|uniref:DUF1643 domain-containing protein n=1 Tax=Henriciella mobilis TaxID=2305467 RepID=UPI000E66AB91|nr:DUF1643 domain-containing protein [Henriciella mobilis]RIJ15972.1 DUF1643 domain-containing protein [Henriciella mobilis]RIJ21182.1 DUF1643 domain-containing protein [Henriciella mobilis]RIJ23117.1 DUF1643 domain-containing protein [Henriciella mobilis]